MKLYYFVLIALFGTVAQVAAAPVDSSHRTSSTQGTERQAMFIEHTTTPVGNAVSYHHNSQMPQAAAPVDSSHHASSTQGTKRRAMFIENTTTPVGNAVSYHYNSQMPQSNALNQPNSNYSPSMSSEFNCVCTFYNGYKTAFDGSDFGLGPCPNHTAPPSSSSTTAQPQHLPANYGTWQPPQTVDHALAQAGTTCYPAEAIARPPQT